MTNQVFRLEHGEGPLVATAVHDGHSLRDDISDLTALDDSTRFREEDPFTAEWTVVAPIRVVATHSRFEVDLNRPRESAVYRRPDDAWGLNLWKADLPDESIEKSLEEYDSFYAEMRHVLDEVERKHGQFVVFDIHSYNHRRPGPDKPPSDRADNPQVNVGTGTMDRARWSAIVDRFITDLSNFDFPGGRLDVRENVRFRGGYLSRWVHETYPDTGCALALEFKKFFMDEWSGEPDWTVIRALEEALCSTVAGVLEELAPK